MTVVRDVPCVFLYFTALHCMALTSGRCHGRMAVEMDWDAHAWYCLGNCMVLHFVIRCHAVKSYAPMQSGTAMRSCTALALHAHLFMPLLK